MVNGTRTNDSLIADDQIVNTNLQDVTHNNFVFTRKLFSMF